MRLLIVGMCLGLTALATPPGPPVSVMKCAHVPIRFPDAPEPVYVVNGRAVEPSLLKALNPDSIESVEVACADAIYDRFGIKAQRTGIIIFTVPAPAAVLKSAMDSIARLQQAYVARSGRFANALHELEWRDHSGNITIELTVTPDGNAWTAIGSHRFIKGRPITVSGSRKR